MVENGLGDSSAGSQRRWRVPFSLEEMEQYADNDPAALEAMRNAIEVAHAAANRWTDNIFTVRQWVSNNFPQAKEELDNLYKEIGITDDFDYFELSPMPVSSVTD